MKKKVTAAELMAKLNADREFVAKRAAEEAEREQRTAEWERAEVPLVEDLRTAGYAVKSVWDLVNSTSAYPQAIPVLFDHLRRPYPAPVREGIARALAVPAAKAEWQTLTRLYEAEPDDRTRDGLAVAIAAASDDELLDEVIALARNARNGPSRLLLLSALERSRDARARAALMDLGTDPDLQKEIQAILRRLQRTKR